VLPKKEGEQESQPAKPKPQTEKTDKTKVEKPTEEEEQPEETPAEAEEEKLDFSVTVYNEAGKPVPNVRIEISGMASASTVAAGGRADFTAFPPGDYKIKALCVGYLVKVTPFKLVSQESGKSSVSISLQKEKAKETKPVILVGTGKIEIQPVVEGPVSVTQQKNNTEVSIKIDVDKGSFSGKIGGSFYYAMKVVLDQDKSETITVSSNYNGTHNGNYSGTADIGKLTGTATINESSVMTSSDGTRKDSATAGGSLNAELENGVVTGTMSMKEAEGGTIKFKINVHPQE
jgi:hypothetical protein